MILVGEDQKKHMLANPCCRQPVSLLRCTDALGDAELCGLELAVVCGRGSGCRVLIVNGGITRRAGDTLGLYSFEGARIHGPGLLLIGAPLERAARAAGREPVRDCR